MRLLVRGGSLPAAYGVAAGYVDLLRKEPTLSSIDIINRSRFRETSFDALRTFYEDIAPFAPQMLLFHFGIDDAFQGVYRSEFQENMVQVVRLARQLFNPTIFLATAHTFDEPAHMEAVGIFYRSLRVIAFDLNLTLIPVHLYWASYLSERGLKSRHLTGEDPRYPNEEGHRVIADVILRWIGFFQESKMERWP